MKGKKNCSSMKISVIILKKVFYIYFVKNIDRNAQGGD